MSLQKIKELFHKEYNFKKKDTVKIKHFFYTVAYQLEAKDKKFSNEIFYLFHLYQKVLNNVNDNKVSIAENILLDADKIKIELQESEKEIGNILYYSCISYLHYKTKNYDLAKQKILKAIDSVDIFFEDNPLLEMMLKSEYLLNYFRVLVQKEDFEEAKKVSLALLKLVLYQENSKNIVNVKRIETLRGDIKELDTMKFNFINYICRRIILLSESIQNEFISYIAKYQREPKDDKDIFSLFTILNLNINKQHSLFLEKISIFFDDDFIIKTPIPVINIVLDRINNSSEEEYNVNLLKEIEIFKNRFFFS